MNKWFIIFLLVIYLGGCKSNKLPQKNNAPGNSLEHVILQEDDLKKFIRSYPVIHWKTEELKSDRNKTGTQDFQARIDNFAKELGYKSIDEFNYIWIVLATIQAQLNFKKEIEEKLKSSTISAKEKELLSTELKMISEFLKCGFVREDLPKVDSQLAEKYYQELEKLKITELINGS